MQRAVLQWSLWLLLVLLVMSSEVAGHSTVCPIISQQVVSANRDLLPLSGVHTNSESSTFNPLANLVTPSTTPWCTTAGSNSQARPGQEVTLSFTEPVTVAMVKSSGYSNGYVNNFTIEYMLSTEDSDYTTYTATDTKHFYVENLKVMDAYFILDEPIIAQRVRLSILGDILDDGNRTCWELYLFGCAEKDTVMFPDNDVPDAVATTALPMPTLVYSPSPTAEGSGGVSAPTTDPSPIADVPGGGQISSTECDSSGLSQQEVLAIVLPVVLVTVVVIMVIVAIGVGVCLTCRRSCRNSSKEGGFETVTVKVLNHSPAEKPVQLYHPTPRRRVMSEVTRPKSTSSIISRDSTSTFPGRLLYDVPRPLVYDVPRSSFRSRSSTDPTPMEFPNALYDIPPSDQLFLSPMEDADYDEIPEMVSDVSSNVHTSGGVRPPLPSPNKSLSNGVNKLEGHSFGTDVKPSSKGKKAATLSAPYTYAKTKKWRKDKAAATQPPQDNDNSTQANL